ncbi:MAG: cytochrome b/b6 domain-containing protein, partial [Rhodospirillaceae bacterium]
VMMFVLWVKDNFPNKYDLQWLAKGGGLFTEGVHPPSKRFNAGQKLIFWSVVVGGASLSVSGLALLFPFELSMFAGTFKILNAFGTSFPTELSPLQETQYALMWHGIVAFGMIAIIIGHIYIGSVGMEGAIDAVGDGHVDLNWAKEHHGLWVEELEGGTPASAEQQPAE